MPAAGRRAPGFLKLLLFALYACVCVYVSVCVSAPEGINNQWRDMVWYRPCVIGWIRSTAFGFLDVDKMDGRGLSNTARRERLAKNDEVDAVLAIEGGV